ncbi:hypothetical protein C8P68_10242 [Mucilaginibacter yixingensis]|uniref:Uncharacterized protein n=2 Tax=Mucilaginibacter yixingensis TaxID=1295612 RepID=A0A2T5JBU4_9SPHI|nr:hypothetical protein C8P68_10242 [Mucilaginibacter yixingensis]
MKQQDVFKKIGGIINEINDQYDYLATTNGQFNDLELELLVANAHFLSDYIEVLRKVISQEEAQHKADQTVLPPHVVTTQVEAKKEVDEVKKVEEVKEEPKPVIPVATPVATPAPLPVPEPVKPTPPPVPVQSEEPAPKTNEPRYFEPVVERVAVYAQPSEPAVKEEPKEEPANTFEFDIPSAPKAAEPEPEKTEPETIRHQLNLEDLGDAWEDEDEEYIEEAPEVKKEPVQKSEPQPTPVAKSEPESAPVKPVMERAPEPPSVLEETISAIKEPLPTIVIEKEEVLTFNQRISAQMGTAGRVSDQLHAQSISDLKSAISLNDKLLYVKDLFNGYSLAYSEAIEILNRFKSFEEADSFLKSYSTKNHWADKPATTEKFYALLHKRYGE